MAKKVKLEKIAVEVTVLITTIEGGERYGCKNDVRLCQGAVSEPLSWRKRAGYC